MALFPTSQTATIEAALDKLMCSTALGGSPRLCQFLDYIVRRTLSGEGDSIKEYTIGVEVFDRGPRFDPRCDAIVRVQAHTLRERLREYYETEGSAELVTIEVPRGGYRPLFQVNERAPARLLEDHETLSRFAERLVLQATPDGLQHARTLLERAIGRRPDGATLHVALASTLLFSVELEQLSPAEAFPLVRMAARAALRVDPLRLDARLYLVLPSIRWPDKSHAIRAALDNTRTFPRSAVAHFLAASVCAADGRMREAASHMDLAVRLQPDALFFHTRRAVSLWWSGNCETALRHLRDIVTVDPHNALALHWLGQVCASTGHYDEARDAAMRAYECCPTPPILGGLGWVEAMAGRVASARPILNTLAQLSSQQFVATSRLAAIQVAIGDSVAGAAAFARGLREGDWHLAWAHCDPRWRPLRAKVAAA